MPEESWIRMSYLYKGIGVLTRTIVGLIIAPILIVLYLLCWVRVKVTACIYYSKDKSILSREDVLPMPDVEHADSLINFSILTRGHFSLDDMKELFLSKVLNATDANNRPQFPRFTKYTHICAGYLMWTEESNFDIDDHIRLYCGQPPNDEEQLKTLITDLCHKPLPLSKSGWEIIVVPLEYRQSDAPQTCILFRVHHCIGDGMSILRLIIEQMAGNHGAFQYVLKQSQNKYKQKFENRFVDMFVNVTRVIYQYIFPQSSIPPNQNIEVFMKEKINEDSKLSDTGYIDWTSAIKMDTIRRIKTATSTTVNDVIMSCMAGAFRKYFLKHDLCPPDFLTSGTPFTFHGPDDPVQMINKAYPMLTLIPTGDMDRLQRLKATKFEMDQVKSSPDIIISRWFAQYLVNTIPYTLLRKMDECDSINVLFSNLPGSTSKVAFNGNTIESMAIMTLPNRHTGFTVFILTYSGDVTVSVSVDKARVSSREDLRQLLDDFVEEVQQLFNTVVGSPNKQPSTATGKKVD